jgi:hypothetical protein
MVTSNLFRKIVSSSTYSFLSVLTVAVLFADTISAQNSTFPLSVEPLESNPIIKKHLEDYPSFGRNNQVCPADTLTLPFFDDFANNGSVYPNCTKWQDNHVFVNEAMAIAPPSIGVATFDGLAPDGTPYNQFANPSDGLPADTLTSQHLDLSGLATTDNIFLSFYLEAEGLGDRPQVQDSFFVEFKDSADAWITIAQYEGIDDSISTLTVQGFRQIFLPINETRYLYKGFQFRFRNHASITGNNDHWHLDYVYLEDNRTNANPTQANFGSYADVAYTALPNSPLVNGYLSMPWRHFAANPMYNDSITLANYNHNPCNVAGTLDRLYEVNEVSPNNTVLLNMPIATLANYSCSPNSDDEQTYATVGTWGVLAPTEKTVIESKISILFPSGFQSGTDFVGNDTATRTTVLDNYFAYDDGTAEHRAIARRIGTKIAVEFQAEVADTLRGVYFHLPYVTNRNAEIDFINVKVWLDSLQNEVFSRDFYRLRYEASFNGFHYVTFEDYTGRKIPIPVQAGQKFYVGWQQASKEEVPVGFDKSNDASDKTFVSVGTSWINSPIKGAIMIRPLLSMSDTFTLIPIEKIEKNTATLRIFPNPTKEQVYLELDNIETEESDYQIQLNNMLGQQVYQGNFVTELSLRDYDSGVYILTLINRQGNIIAQRKIIKQQ